MQRSIDEMRSVVSEALKMLDIDDYSVAPNGLLTFRHGSAVVSIEFIDIEVCWLIRTYCTVLSNVALTHDLLWKVVALNSILEWGNLAVGIEDEESRLPGQIGEGYVLLSHAIVGDFVDIEEVVVSVKFVAGMADDIDDMMKDVFGGLTGEDFIEQMAEVLSRRAAVLQ